MHKPSSVPSKLLPKGIKSKRVTQIPHLLLFHRLHSLTSTTSLLLLFKPQSRRWTPTAVVPLVVCHLNSILTPARSCTKSCKVPQRDETTKPELALLVIPECSKLSMADPGRGEVSWALALKCWEIFINLSSEMAIERRFQIRAVRILSAF
jgi:hypothetical protein